MRKVKGFWTWINIIRSVPAILVMFFSKSGPIIKKDIERWMDIINTKESNKSYWIKLHWLLLYFPAFRNLFYHRVKKYNFIMTQVLKIFYRPLSTLYIYTEEIGEGLYIQHGFSTIISAKKIGKNCSINQQVTIGYNQTENPIIGDNVLITSGAKVLGKVNVGNNSKIGANCVVVKDIPERCTVIGVPARIVRKDGKRVDIAL